MPDVQISRVEISVSFTNDQLDCDADLIGQSILRLCKSYLGMGRHYHRVIFCVNRSCRTIETQPLDRLPKFSCYTNVEGFI